MAPSSATRKTSQFNGGRLNTTTQSNGGRFNTTTTKITPQKLSPHPPARNRIPPPPPPPPPAAVAKAWVENRSPATLLSPGSPCFDFFSKVAPRTTKPENLTRLLSLAWNNNPLTTLKLIYHLRKTGVGKSDKEGFYAAALWLHNHNHHPQTLSANVNHVVDFGCFKDLPEILYRILEGLDARKKVRRPRVELVKCYDRQTRKYYFVKQSLNTRRKQQRRQAKLKQASKGNEQISHAVQKKYDLLLKKVTEDKIRKQKLQNKEKKRSARKEKVRKAHQRYTSDPDFRVSQDTISQVFANRLVADLKFLKAGEVGKISSASKWCPSLDSSIDRATLLCESIAKTVFSSELYPEYQRLPESHYSYRVCDRLRKEYLVPLRQALKLRDQSNKRVAPVAGPSLPHEILRGIDTSLVAELQWRRMVKDLSNKGKLRNCIAVCDVSETMTGTPMDVCVAFGLLVSELNQVPWKDHVITFSQNPMIQKIKGNNLKEKIGFMKAMQPEPNTNFPKLLDKILQVASYQRLRRDQMVEKIYLFSDKEFGSSSWSTDYQQMQKKFANHGYEVPQLVLWNFRQQPKAGSVSGGDPNGVKLVYGLSKKMMTLFLDEDKLLMESTSPDFAMKIAISGSEFSQLVVLD